MSIKKILPILIVVVVGFLTLISHFINNDTLDTFVREDATGWYNIIAAFAVFLGSLNLIKFQSLKIAHKKRDWHYSILTLLSFFIMIFFSFFMKGTPNSELYEDRVNGHYDEGEIFIDSGKDLNNKVIQDKICGMDQNKNIIWDSCTPNPLWNSNYGNNKWNEGEYYSDVKNGKYDVGIIYNPKWDEGEDFIDIGNSQYDKGEEFIDQNKNKKYDIGEIWYDIGNQKYDKGEKWYDEKPLYMDVKPERFIDAGYDSLGNYIYDKFCKIDESGEILWNSCISNPDFSYGNGKWDKEIAWGSHVSYDGDNNNKYDGFYPGSYVKWIYQYIYTPLSATMFALLAFFVASASYRAFRIRNFEATLLLVAGVLLMLGRVPLGNTTYIPWWLVLSIYVFGIFALIAPFFKNKKILFLSIILSFIIFGIIGIVVGWNSNPPEFLQLPSIQRWIFFNPQLAAARAIKIGIALGIIATSFRIITGRERGIFGD